MSILRGHEDLKSKAIVGFEMGYALVQCDEQVKRYRLAVGPAGNLIARPVEEKPQSIDQLKAAGGDEQELRARRLHGVDQI